MDASREENLLTVLPIVDCALLLVLFFLATQRAVCSMPVPLPDASLSESKPPVQSRLVVASDGAMYFAETPAERLESRTLRRALAARRHRAGSLEIAAAKDVSATVVQHAVLAAQAEGFSIRLAVKESHHEL